MHEPPLHSVHSPLRSIGRMAGLCYHDCSECDCPGIVAVALLNRIEDKRELAQLTELPTDILQLIQATSERGHQIVVNECHLTDHQNITNVPKKIGHSGSDDDL